MLERQILGACMLDNKALEVAFEKLTASDFSEDTKQIFEILQSLHEQGKSTDQFSVNNLYGDLETLMKITGEVGTTKLIKQQCDNLKEVSIRKTINNRLMEMAHGENIPLEEIRDHLNTISHQIETNDVQSEIRDVDTKPYTGMPDIYTKFISTGLPTIDHALDDLVGGLVTLVAGRNNGGKTTFVNQVISNAIDTNFKVLVVNGEEKQDVTINKIYKSVVGRDEKYSKGVKLNKRYRTEPTAEALAALREWHRGKLKVYSKGDSKLKTTEQLFNMVKKEIKKSNTDLLVMDNLMSLLTVTSDIEKNGRQADFLKNCCTLAKEYNVHIIVVLHPNKTYVKGQQLDSEQIAGTSDLMNQADNIITVVREYEPEKIAEGINGYIKVQKNREFSDLPEIEVWFEEATGLLLERDAFGNAKAYNFKWKQYLEDTPPWDD